MPFNTYRIRRVQLDNDANVRIVGKRCGIYSTPEQLNVGGMYFLKKDKLFRIEALVSSVEV
jgi:hypothetical protein